MAKIVFKINPESGDTELRSEGYVGGSCKDRTKIFEKALGVVTSDTHTLEAYQEETNQQTEQQW
jgi:hypothetical protein